MNHKTLFSHVCRCVIPLVLVWLFSALAPYGHGEPEQGVGAPTVVCDEPVYKYGEVTNTVLVVHDFLVRNTGVGPLNLERVKAGCGCSQATLSGTPVAPGGTGVVHVTMSLAGRVGRRTVAVLLYCDDPANRVVALRLDGTALQPPGASVLAGSRPASMRMPLPSERRPSGTPHSAREPVARPELSSRPDDELVVLPAEVVLADPSTGQPRLAYVLVKSPKGAAFRVVATRTNLPESRIVRDAEGAGWVRFRLGPFASGEIPPDAFLAFETDWRGDRVAFVTIRGGS